MNVLIFMGSPRIHGNTAELCKPVKLMSIALKPLCQPPFPIERIEEMTLLMGGDGSLRSSKHP